VAAAASPVRAILAAQAVRALGYGFGSVLLGVTLQARGWSPAQVGLLFTFMVAGVAIMSAVGGTFADRIGRRRFYAALFLTLSVAGAVFAMTDRFWILALAALTGTLSTDVVESGPFSALEQAMLPTGLDRRGQARIFGLYNATATVLGSFGALLAGGPSLLRHLWPTIPADQRFFLLFVPIGVAGALLARSLPAAVEVARSLGGNRQPLRRSRQTVLGLASLFAVDALAGGFVVQSFIAYWFRLRFGLSLEVLGLLFFCIGFLQAGSFLLAVRLAGRIGLLNTMVFTHLPSNLLLAAIPLAPTLPLAVALLFARFALSQMDVPTRQAYIVTLVDPDERTAAAAYTGTARYVMRPLGPTLAGLSQQLWLGLPFLLAGGIKVAYDLTLWSWFRRVPLPQTGGQPPSGSSRCHFETLPSGDKPRA